MQVEITDLYKAVSSHGGSAILSYPVVTKKASEMEEKEPQLTDKGVLNIWCKFGKTETVQPPSLMKKVLVTGVMASLCMFFRSKMEVDLPLGTPSFIGKSIDWAPSERLSYMYVYRLTG